MCSELVTGCNTSLTSNKESGVVQDRYYWLNGPTLYRFAHSNLTNKTFYYEILWLDGLSQCLLCYWHSIGLETRSNRTVKIRPDYK